MKRLNWWHLFVIMFVAVGIAACGSDNDEPGVGPIDPNVSVDDPVGTVELSMMKSSGSNKTYLGNSNIYINDSYNFTGANFVSLGKVNGLGNVSHIPTEGWASSVAVNPGYGYVAYYSGVWYRIFVVKELEGTSGGVIGYKIKYQTPFKGIDEAISFEQESLTFDADGGTANVLFKNKYIVPFTIKVESDAEWCHVQTCSSYDQYFLANGISITVDPTKETQKVETVVTLTTLYGKTTKFKVIRSGSEPYAEFGTSELTVEPSKQDISNISVSSNCVFGDLNVTSSASWCKAKLVDSSAKLRANAIKFVGDNPVSEADTRAANESSVKLYELHLEIADNLDNDERTAEIIVKSKTGQQSSGMALTQKKGKLQFRKSSEAPFRIDAAVGTSDISYSTSAEVENLEVMSDAEWCTPVLDGYTVRITYSENSGKETRNCKITLSAKGGTLKDDLEISQMGGYLEFDRGSETPVEMGAGVGSSVIPFRTSIKVENLEVMSDVEWCTPLIDGFTIWITCLENISDQARDCRITLSSKDGVLKDDLEITQIGKLLRPSNSEIYLDRKSTNISIALATNFATVEPLSDVSWCTFSYNVAAKTVTLRVEQNTGEERTATISFKNSIATIKIIQSKYAVGDAYSEDGIVGTVSYMQDSIRYVASENLGNFVWSTENVATGATDQYDGRKNMNIIRKIPNWKVLYPAFAAVETLNARGVTGWYLPACKEVRIGVDYWSSSEIYSSVAYYFTAYVSASTTGKSSSLSVVGVHRF